MLAFFHGESPVRVGPREGPGKPKEARVAFSDAQFAFADPLRVIAEDLSHSSSEKRYYCFGWVERGILTVRFTYRENVIRIYGAGYWRKGKGIYERENQVHRGPLGNLRVIPDFLPPPEDLVFRDEGVKVTIALQTER